MDGEIKLSWRINNTVTGTVEVEHEIPLYHLTGGSHFFKHEPDLFTLHSRSSDNRTYYFTGTYSASAQPPIFFTEPQYLYSLVRLGNNSKLVIPKGENAVLMLLPKGLSSKAVTEFILSAVLSQDSIVCSYIGVQDAVKHLSKPDDPLSKLVLLSWSVEGEIGYLAQTAPKKVPIVAPAGFDRSLGRAFVYGDHREERGRLIGWKTNLFGLDYNTTTVFAPSSLPAPSIVNYLEPVNDICSNTAAYIASKLSAMYIIKPSIYNGSGKVRLQISNARGVPLANFRVNVEVGDERFKNIEAALKGVYSESTSGPEYAFHITDLHRLSIERKGYDEFGSLRLIIRRSGVHIDTGVERGYYYKEERRSMGFAGYAEISIGGWLPNPPPPGSVIYVPQISYTADANPWRSAVREEELGSHSGCDMYTDPPRFSRAFYPNGSPVNLRWLYWWLCGGAPIYFEKETVNLTDIDAYSGKTLSVQQRRALIQLGPQRIMALSTGYIDLVVDGNRIEQRVVCSGSSKPYRSLTFIAEIWVCDDSFYPPRCTYRNVTGWLSLIIGWGLNVL